MMMDNHTSNKTTAISKRGNLGIATPQPVRITGPDPTPEDLANPLGSWAMSRPFSWETLLLAADDNVLFMVFGPLAAEELLQLAATSPRGLARLAVPEVQGCGSLAQRWAVGLIGQAAADAAMSAASAYMEESQAKERERLDSKSLVGDRIRNSTSGNLAFIRTLAGREGELLSLAAGLALTPRLPGDAAADAAAIAAGLFLEVLFDWELRRSSRSKSRSFPRPWPAADAAAEAALCSLLLPSGSLAAASAEAVMGAERFLDDAVECVASSTDGGGRFADAYEQVARKRSAAEFLRCRLRTRSGSENSIGSAATSSSSASTAASEAEAEAASGGGPSSTPGSSQYNKTFATNQDGTNYCCGGQCGESEAGAGPAFCSLEEGAEALDRALHELDGTIVSYMKEGYELTCPKLMGGIAGSAAVPYRHWWMFLGRAACNGWVCLHALSER
ncbi:unnamed protein product [Polarella glacialis]|uniref:Uncharacterized protein n=1 Tax=Polarella glacialis TaxID=89957 RepID=A0A813HF77_POLGL|nr:unnamed protein product [Polarella glacialis]